MAGSDDLWAWLQSIMQNPGASQPYGPGTPTGGAGPQSLMPGGGVMGHGAATPGGPSMGYPALSQMFGISPAQAGELPPDVTASAMNRLRSHAAALANGAAPQLGPGDVPIPPGAVPPMPQPRPAGSQAPPFNWLTSTGAGMSAPPTGPLASPDAAAAPPMKRRAGAANLGYYQPNDRFVQLDQGQNTDPTARNRGPQMTALNLAGLFNRGQQPGVNPNAPAANAQPVSAAGPSPFANAPMPPVMSPDIQNQRIRNAVNSPNWWQNL